MEILMDIFCILYLIAATILIVRFWMKLWEETSYNK